MKKIFALLLTLTFFAALGLPTAAANVPRLVDNAGIVGVEYEEQLLTYLDEKSAELEFDIAVLTEESIGGADIVAYADDYYDYNGFDTDGILLVIVMDTREWAFSTSGFGITVFGDYELGELEDAMLDALSDGDYAQGIYNYAQGAAGYVDYAKEYGYDFSEDGYYTDNAPPYRDAAESEPMHPLKKLAICAVIGVIISMIVILIMRGSMNTVHKKTAASDYVRSGSLNVYRSNDYFINKTVSKTRRASETNNGGPTHHGGGSVHISSSGSSHGGSHGHF